MNRLMLVLLLVGAVTTTTTTTLPPDQGSVAPNETGVVNPVPR